MSRRVTLNGGRKQLGVLRNLKVIWVSWHAWSTTMARVLLMSSGRWKRRRQMLAQICRWLCLRQPRS